jgi:hypothetical protein
MERREVRVVQTKGKWPQEYPKRIWTLNIYIFPQDVGSNCALHDGEHLNSFILSSVSLFVCVGDVSRWLGFECIRRHMAHSQEWKVLLNLSQQSSTTIDTTVTNLTDIEDGCVSGCGEVLYCWRIMNWTELRSDTADLHWRGNECLLEAVMGRVLLNY